MKNPTTVKSAGKIVGGIWDHQENSQDYIYDDEEGHEKYSGLNHTHLILYGLQDRIASF